MTDYAEFLTEIDRLRREIHDACKSKDVELAQGMTWRLRITAKEFETKLIEKVRENDRLVWWKRGINCI